MVNIHPKGRLGNLMFQYALSRIISERMDYATDMDLPFDNAKMLRGRICKGSVQKLTGHTIDLKAIFDNKKDRRIFLQGYFQQLRYYAYHKEEIKQWFHIKENYRKPGMGDLVIHVRGGDLYRKGCNIQHVPCPYSYYKSIIDKSEYDKLFIVTERPDDIIVQKIHVNYKSEIISQSVLEDYYFMLHASKLVMSVCTIVWWAAWLGKAKEVHFPLLGFWHPESVRKDIDLIVKDNKYIYHDLGVMDHWNASDEQIEKLILK